MKFLVENIYIVNGGIIRRQIRGIPMGTNCAPVLANLFLYAYESRFIDKLIGSYSTRSIAPLFHMTFRYIDDTLSIDNQHWKKCIDTKEIYPPELVLNDTSPSDPSDPTHFLGMNIHASDHKSDHFRISVFDKRDSFGFHVRRYPQMASLIPQTIPYGVFLGQLHRGYRICTLADDFMDFATDVARRCISNGCGHRRLSQVFSSFVSRFAHKWGSCRSLRTRFRSQFQLGSSS